MEGAQLSVAEMNKTTEWNDANCRQLSGGHRKWITAALFFFLFTHFLVHLVFLRQRTEAASCADVNKIAPRCINRLTSCFLTRPRPDLPLSSSSSLLFPSVFIPYISPLDTTFTSGTSDESESQLEWTEIRGAVLYDAHREILKQKENLREKIV